MAVVDLNLDPANKQLRQFGVIAMVALPLLGWLFSGKPTPATWMPMDSYRIGGLAFAGLFFGLTAWLRPSSLKWIFVALSVVTFPIGLVLGEVILMSVYTIAFVPMALAFRLMRRDALQRTLDRDAATYWQPKVQSQDASSYYRQS